MTARSRPRIVYIDSFGNARLGGRPADLEAAIGSLEPGRPLFEVDDGPNGCDDLAADVRPARRGPPLLYQDSFGTRSRSPTTRRHRCPAGLVADQPVRIRAA